MLAAGSSAAAIAEQLFLSPETVRTHVRNAMLKLDAKTRLHAVVVALARGEIAFPERGTGLFANGHADADRVREWASSTASAGHSRPGE